MYFECNFKQVVFPIAQYLMGLKKMSILDGINPAKIDTNHLSRQYF